MILRNGRKCKWKDLVRVAADHPQAMRLRFPKFSLTHNPESKLHEKPWRYDQ